MSSKQTTKPILNETNPCNILDAYFRKRSKDINKYISTYAFI